MSSRDDFPKWQQQVEKLAGHFEQDLINNPRIFAHYKEMVQANSAVDTPAGARFHRWVERNHYYALLAALRKIFLATDKNEFSLLKIIEELIGSGNVVTAANYPSLIGVDGGTLIGAAAAASASDGFFGADGRLDIQKLTSDRDFLLNTLRPQLKFVNETVLHIQKTPKATVPREEELRQSIERLKGLLQEYRLFLTGKEVAWSIEDFSWAIIFTTPWLNDETFS